MKTQEINGEVRSTRFKQMKLIARTIDDELLLFDEETSNAHCLNGIAGEMWMACERASTAVEVADVLRTQWPDMEKEVVWASLSRMAAAGLLEETIDEENISTARRDLIRKIGLTAAIVLPIVVTSVLIPSPAAAASCASFGQSCATKPCCPGAGLGCVAGFCVNLH